MLSSEYKKIFTSIVKKPEALAVLFGMSHLVLAITMFSLGIFLLLIGIARPLGVILGSIGFLLNFPLFLFASTLHINFYLMVCLNSSLWAIVFYGILRFKMKQKQSHSAQARS